MKCVRLGLLSALTLCISCSAIFGERGSGHASQVTPPAPPQPQPLVVQEKDAAETAASMEPQVEAPVKPTAEPVVEPVAVEPVAVTPVQEETRPDLAHLPRWVRPTEKDLESSRGLVEAVRFLDLGEAERAAVQLQQVRSAARFGSEVIALHAWALAEAGEVQAAESVARDGIANHGATPALGYVMAVIFEMQERPGDAFPLYRDLSTLVPQDASMLRACARTAVAARRGAEALPYLDRLMLVSALDIDGKKLRATALQLSGREEDALALYQQMIADWPQDYRLLAEVSEATFQIARSSTRPEHQELALELLQRLTEADPQRASAFRQLGQIAVAMQLYEEATAALQRCLELEPSNVEAGLELASILVMDGDAQGSADVLLDLLRQPLSGSEVEAVQSALLELR